METGIKQVREGAGRERSVESMGDVSRGEGNAAGILLQDWG